jgi:AraC-like DNA-binding protein
MIVAITLDCFTIDKDYPFFIQYGSHDTDLYMHSHADYTELVIVLSGTAIHKVDTESYFIKKGDVFVISNDTTHGYEKTIDFRICNIMFRPERLRTIHSDIRKLSGFHALFMIEPYITRSHSFQSRLQLQLVDFEQVNNILSCMLQEYIQKTDGWKAMMDAYFMNLVVFLSRTYSQPCSYVKCNIINIAKSVSYIESNYTDAISIEALAMQSNLSMRHFTRIFRATYNTTPSNYILLLRLQYACLLLKNTTYNISEIASLSGFNNGNYFTRQFHNNFQVTPKEYRLLNQTQEINRFSK